MANLDTPDKRVSGLTCRRQIWLRRHLPRPDGTVAAGDRAQLAATYRMALADVDDAGTITAAINSLFPPYAQF